MSGQWEVVGKTKKDKQTGKSKKLSKNEKKMFVDNAPKVEDLLPLAQVKTLYAALDTNKDPPKPKPIEKAMKTKENEAKKDQKKPKEKKEPIVKGNKPPKTIEAAVALIKTGDVQNCLEAGQARFPDAPLVWLKGLASWLNTKLPVDHTDNNFTAKSWEYPLCLLSADTRAVLKKTINDLQQPGNDGLDLTAKPVVQMFFDFCLMSMVNDMSKGSPVTGYKILLQLVASQVPAVSRDFAKSASLRLSYQNRPAIGCSLMWALGQCGFKDLTTGLQVWSHVMFPVYELRNYNHFVRDYLKHLLARHLTSKALSVQIYNQVLETVYSTRQPPDNELKTHLQTLEKILFNERVNTMFWLLLANLDRSNNPVVRDQFLKLLVDCMDKSMSQSVATWFSYHSRYMLNSNSLARHLCSNWSSLRTRLQVKQLEKHLKNLINLNASFVRNPKTVEIIQESTQLCEDLLNKMNVKKSSFPWKTLVFTILTIVALGYDINFHSDLKESYTGILLKKIGVMNYCEPAVVRIQEVSGHVYRWGEQQFFTYGPKVAATMLYYTEYFITVAYDLAAQFISLVKQSAESSGLLKEDR